MGCSVISLVRVPLNKKSSEAKDVVFFDPNKNYLDIESIEGIDAIINLSGASIATRWSEKNKQILRGSRIKTTSVLVDAVLKLKRTPSVFISASAVGIYGNRNTETICEKSKIAQNDFLSKLCADWEYATNKLIDTRCRIVNLRLGLVLDKGGGMLKKMIPIFKLGLGATIGRGNQYMSWISMTDILNLIEFVLINQNMSGAINATSPNPITNKEFSKALAKVFKKPCFLNIPTPFIKAFMGEMGNLLLTGQKVVPKKVIDAGLNLNTHR